MKKLKVNDNLDQIISSAKEAGYTYSIKPAGVSVTWIIINEDKKSIQFEYGGDSYEYQEVGMEYFTKDMFGMLNPEIMKQVYLSMVMYGESNAKMDVENNLCTVDGHEIKLYLNDQYGTE